MACMSRMIGTGITLWMRASGVGGGPGVPAPASTYTLTAAVGVFVLSGEAMTPLVDYKLPADVGVFVETGVSAGLLAGHAMPAAAGSFALTGVAATLTKSASGFTLVASGASVGTASSPIQVTIDSTGANFIAVHVSQYNGVTIGTLTENKGNGAPTGLTAKTASSAPYSRIYYWAVPTVGSGHTFTFDTGGLVLGEIAVQAWSGANASPFDVENGATSDTLGTASFLQTGSVNPSQNNSLIITGFSANPGTSISINGGYTITANVDGVGGVNIAGAMAYLVQGTAAATNPTWTIGGGGPTDLAATIAVFKP